MPNAGALTFAAIEVAPVPTGVAKPVGAVITRFAVPGPTGWNVVGRKFVSVLKTTGLSTIVPTVVSELVTVTLAVNPVRTFWKASAVRVVAFNCAAATVKLVSVENEEVLKSLLSHSNPEGVRFTVAVPLA